MSFKPLTIQTIEDALAGERAWPLVPEGGEPLSQFRLNDPFGVRRAIIPLSWAEPDGDLAGLGRLSLPIPGAPF